MDTTKLVEEEKMIEPMKNINKARNNYIRICREERKFEKNIVKKILKPRFL